MTILVWSVSHAVSVGNRTKDCMLAHADIIGRYTTMSTDHYIWL